MNRGQASDRIIKAALPMGQKLMLLVYLMHQSSKDSPETGVSWPALPTLALHLQMSRSFVIEARKALTDAKILIADTVGEGEAIRYRINFDLIPALSEDESAAYKNKIREHRSPKGVQRVHPRGPGCGPPGVQDVDPQGSSVDTPRGPARTPQGSSAYTRTVSKEPSVVDPSPVEPPPGNRHQGTGGAEVSATVTDSPPPAEPSGPPADLWAKAADLADPEAWRSAEEFQPSSDAYVFDDADPVGASEQPSDPRQIESPATRAPEAPPQGLRPSPTHPPGNGEGAPGGATAPQSAPSLFGRTDTAPEAQTPAKAPPRARKATAAALSAAALAVYGAWRVYHPRAAETPTPGTLRALGSLLTEAGGLDGALLLMEWAHVGTCERARQLRGEHPWPDGRRTVYTDLGSLSRHVASRLEMAHDWKDKSTDKASGLNVIHLDSLPRGSARGPDRISAISRLLQQEYQNADY